MSESGKIRSKSRFDFKQNPGESGGAGRLYFAVTDKSPPEQIYSAFGVSKKVFKQAIGGLYKQRKILIEEEGIRLVDS